MKKSLLIIAAAGAVVPAISQAQSSVTVYGRTDISMDHVSTNAAGGQLAMTDNASRLGFKGVEDIGGGMKVAFGLEVGIGLDSGGFASATSQFRNSYISLATGFGTFAMGRLDSSNPTGSPLYSQITKNIVPVVHDAGAPAFGTKVVNARNRTSNSFGYMSPTFGGFNVRARYYQLGPDVSTAPGAGIVNEDDHKALDLGLNYANGPLALGLGYAKESRRGGFTANNFKNKWQAVGAYDFGVVKAYGTYGRDSYNNTATSRADVDYWLVGASAPFGASRVTANYMEREVQTDRNGKLKKFQIGYSYSLSKRTQLYALYDREDPNSNVANDRISIISTGIQHNF